MARPVPSGSVLNVVVRGEPAFATPLDVNSPGSFSKDITIDVPINVTSANQVVKLEASTALEAYAPIFGTTEPYSMNLNMSFLRDGQQIFTGNTALSNSFETEYQRIALTPIWADVPAPVGQHVYTLEISASVFGATIEQTPNLMPISFVVTHIQL